MLFLQTFNKICLWTFNDNMTYRLMHSTFIEVGFFTFFICALCNYIFLVLFLLYLMLSKVSLEARKQRLSVLGYLIVKCSVHQRSSIGFSRFPPLCILLVPGSILGVNLLGECIVKSCRGSLGYFINF